MRVRSIELYPGCVVPVVPPEPGWLVICPSRAPASLTLMVLGDADISTAHQLRAALVHAVEDPASGDILVDLTGLDFCDLQGLDALYAGLDAADDAGRAMRLSNSSLRLAWLMRRFPRKRAARTVRPLTPDADWSGDPAA